MNTTGEKWFLMVSRDCGTSYAKEAEADVPEKLLPYTKKLGLFRWTIEREDGLFFDVSNIHKNITRAISVMGQKEAEKVEG